jgi:hypothetical protein
VASKFTLGGTAFLLVNGQQKQLRGNLTVSPSNIERTGVAGQDGVHGFTVMPRVPFISCDITDSDGLSIEDLDGLENVTVTAQLANSKVYVLRNAWCKASHEINTREGSLAVRFEGVGCEELLETA